MADLGTLLCTTPKEVFSPFDIALGWNITNNPITCYGVDYIGPKKEDWKTFAGQVKDASGAGLARVVVVLERDTLRVVARTTSSGTGDFSVKVPRNVQHIVFRLDDSNNLVAVDRVTPV